MASNKGLMVAVACGMSLGLLGVQTVHAAVTTEWNESTDPDALYGRCDHVGTSALASRIGAVYAEGETLANVLAITVLACGSGPGGSGKVPCPPGSPYAYCLASSNDGVGNKYLFGVLRVAPGNDPNLPYTGCPASAQPKPKLRLLRLAGRDPRRINGIVTLSCQAATAPGLAPTTVAQCPAGPHPYAYCLQTANDGYGNAVRIGVVAANGAGDPYGLYGECDTGFQSYGFPWGFGRKSDLVRAVGRSVDNLRSMDILSCGPRWGYGPAMPSDRLEARPCSDLVQAGWMYPLMAGRYDYCIWGVDSRRNAVVVGVNN